MESINSNFNMYQVPTYIHITAVLSLDSLLTYDDDAVWQRRDLRTETYSLFQKLMSPETLTFALFIQFFRSAGIDFLMVVR